MAGASNFIRVPLLLICVFQASDNRHVPFDGGEFFQDPGNPEVDPVSDGTTFNDTILKSPDFKQCRLIEETLSSLDTQLQEAARRNNQLDDEAFALRREVRQLELKLSTCTSALTSAGGSYHTQLQIKLNNLLEVFDNEIFQVLRIMTLTRDVRALQMKVDSAINSEGNSTKTAALQARLNTKISELNAEKQKINRSDESLALILSIVSLQNQIWDLQQEKSTSKAPLNVDGRLLALQKQLDMKLSGLQSKDDYLFTVLQLFSVRSKITMMEKSIKILKEKSTYDNSHVQRELRQKTEQLKRAILQLSDQENDQKLTREILKLQMEVDRLSGLVSNSTITWELRLRAMEVELEEKKKEEANLQAKLKTADPTVAQLIMKIISIMEVQREQQETITGPPKDILTLLQTYKEDYDKAQAEIKNLKEQLGQTQAKSNGIQEQYNLIKTELEQRIAELNKTEDSEAALIMTVINLQGEIKALTKQISTSADDNEIARLQRLLEQKQKALKAKTGHIEREIPNPQTILQIIELQNKIWELQSKPTIGATDEITVLQRRLDGLLTEIDSKDQKSIKQTMTILTLQSEVEYLQTLLLGVNVSQSHRITHLQNQLEAKQAELDRVLREVAEQNRTNANLLVKISLLQGQRRKLEHQMEKEKKISSATISELTEQLKNKEEENQELKALIKTLQSSLNQTGAQCSLYEQQTKDLQNNLNNKIEELNSKTDNITSLALQVSTLSMQLEELKKQLGNSVSQSKVQELQRIIEQKNAELEEKVEKLRQQSTQAERFLQIIALQVEIEQKEYLASNESDYVIVRALQEQLNYLIEGIQDIENDNTKLTLKILAQQDELARLRTEEEKWLKPQAEKIKDLENELELVRNRIKDKTKLLETSTTRIANLSAQIMESREQAEALQEEISVLQETYAKNVADLRERNTFVKKKLQSTELQLKHADEQNFKLIMDIAELRAKLKKTGETGVVAEKTLSDLKEQIKTQEKENRKLEIKNKDLRLQMKELEMCCNANTQCEDVQRELQQSQEDADRLHQQLQEKDAAFRQLQLDFELQRQEKHRLQEDYDNAMRRLINVDDTTIYNTKITWDPDTAHPRLVLSGNNTIVTTTNNVFHVQDNPGRFNVILGVLGATGFSSGRHYWEMSVGEKKCYLLGMASESSRRKGSIQFKPSNGFWTIFLNKRGELKAVDEKPVNLLVQTPPSTLGILLDYKKGKISFYDSNTRSLLYTFKGQEFRGKMYPFLYYCVEDVEEPQPIVLLPPKSTNWIV